MGSEPRQRESNSDTSEGISRTKTSGAGTIRVHDLTKIFDTESGEEVVFEAINFDIEPGSFVTMIGRSGSGKSTLLNIISGVLEPTSGRIEFGSADDGEVTLGHVFQSPRLLPWDTCLENIEYVHENNSDYTDELAKEYMDLVGLSEHYHKYPSQLSGGQRQRVGITRALSIDPEILLMDEPFSNLDEITAEELRNELIEIWQDLNKTVFFITHDITEAIQLSDRILMLGNGRIFDDMEIDLERPRDIDSEKFLKVRQNAINRFHAIK